MVEETNTADDNADRPTPTRIAAETLRSRLAKVLSRFALAAERWEETPEHVHRMRVAARRAVAALDLYRTLLPRRRTRQLRDDLQRARRVSDAARDCDVLAGRLEIELPGDAPSALREQVRTERRSAQRPIIEVYCDLAASGLLARRSQELISRLRWGRRGARGREPRPGRFARRHLRRPVKQFFHAAEADLDSIELLHKFRIRGKQLRYSLELLSGTLRRKPARWLRGQVTRLQDKLGAVVDHAAAEENLRRWIDSLQDPQLAAPLQKMLADEGPRLDAAREEFVRWWTPQRAQALRRRFRKLLGV